MPEFKPVSPKPASEVGASTYSVTKSEKLIGGEADNRPDSDFCPIQLKAGIKVEMEHTKDRAAAEEIAKDHLTENTDYYKHLEKMEDKMNSTEKSLSDLAKALKALAVLGLGRRARMSAAYTVGVGEGRKAAASPFTTQDLSKEPLNIGITKEQLRPSYEPPVVPVRRVETPGYIAPKPCSDHEYKTPDNGTKPAKPFWRR